MKVYSKSILFIVFVYSLLICSCSKDVDVLSKARSKVQDSKWISYDKTARYPIPESDLVNTFNITMKILIDDNDSLGYNFVKLSNLEDYIYQDNEMKVVNHSDSVVRMYLPGHFEKKEEFKKFVNSKLRDKWSPMVLLQEEWEHIADTILHKSNYENYFRIVRDEIFNENIIYTEHHIFINSKTALLERFERRNYFNGSLSQIVTIEFSNYKLGQVQEKLTYKLPRKYVSTYGIKKQLENLIVGDVAPEFSGITLDKDSVNLKMFKGQKVLLNFSVVGCGYCKMALDHFNQNDYTLIDSVSVIYISPHDNEERMRNYMRKRTIPFPVIAEAKEIGEKYRLDAYPKYFLIDENGVIEKVQEGYSKAFIDMFRQ